MAGNISLELMCAGNSFYTDEKAVETYLKKAEDFSEKVYLLLPKAMCFYNHKATHASNPNRSATRACKHLMTTLEPVLKRLDSSKFTWLEWDAIENNKDYKTVLSSIEEFYRNDAMFQKDLDDTTRQVLKQIVAANPGRYFTDGDIPIAANFLLTEIALADSFWSIIGLDRKEEYFFLNYKHGTGVFADFFDGLYETKPISNMKIQSLV